MTKILKLIFLPPLALGFTYVSRPGGPVASRSVIGRPCQAKLSAEEEAEERDIRAEVDRSIKGLYNAEGRPYAPWLMQSLDVEASVAAIRKRRAKERAIESSKERVNMDPQGLEATSIGLKYRLLGERDVELGWLTGEEKDNQGFVVLRRRADEADADWEELASLKTFPALNSKGPEGGFYSYIDRGVEPGQYLYRVLDQDKKGRRGTLCQTGVDIQAKSEQIKTVALVGAFAGLILAGIVASVVYEPLQ